LTNAQQWPENLGVGKPYTPDNRISDYLLGYCYQKLKKPELAELHFNAVEKYFEGRTVGTNATDLINLKLSKTNNRALEIPDNTGSGRRGILNQYMKAYMLGDQEVMKKLESENANLFSNLTFEIVKKTIDLP